MKRTETAEAVKKKTRELFSLEDKEPIQTDLKIDQTNPSAIEIKFGNTSLMYKPEGVADVELSFYNTIPLVGSNGYTLLRFEGSSSSRSPIETKESAKHTLPLFYAHAKEMSASNFEPYIQAELFALKTSSYISANKAIELIVSHPELLSEPDFQVRTMQALTRESNLVDSIIITPQVWEQYLVSLRKIYSEVCDKKEMVSITFLSSIMKLIDQEMVVAKQQVAERAEHPIKDIDMLPNESMVEKIMCTAVQYQGEKALSDRKAQVHNLIPMDIQFSGQLSAACKFLDKAKDPLVIGSMIRKIIPLLTKEDIEQRTNDECTTLLFAWSIACNTVSDEHGWDDHFIAKEKMMTDLLPAFMKKVEGHTTILTNLFSKHNPRITSQQTWQHTENSYEYKTKEGLVIDLQEGRVKDLHAQEVKEFAPLPYKTLQDPYYRQVFGLKELQGKLVEKEGKKTYTIQIDKETFTLELAQNNEVLSIKKTVDNKTFTHIRASLPKDSSTLAYHIKKEGLWQEEGSQKYFLSLKNASNGSSMEIELTVDQNQIKSAMSNGKYVCLAPSKDLEKAFNVTKATNKIMLSTKKDGPITEIAFLDEGMILEKNNEGIWHLKRDDKSQVCSGTLTDLTLSYGIEIQKVIIPLKRSDKKEKEYKIFARPILSTSFKDIPRHVDINEQAEARLLSLHINSQGVMKGHHSAFLYMAQYCLAKGNVSEGSLYLERMLSENASAPQDPSLFKEELQYILKIEKELEAVTPLSDAEASFLLKAALSISNIKRQVYRFKESEPQSKEAIIHHEKRMLDLYNRYSNAIRNPKKKKNFEDKHLILSEKEALQAKVLFKRAVDVLRGLETKNKTAVLEKPTQLSTSLFIHLATLAKPVKPINGSWPTDKSLTKDIIENFFSYAEMIKNSTKKPEKPEKPEKPKKLKEDSTIQLDKLKELEKEIDPSIEPSLKNAIDSARCMLLLMAHTNTFPDLPSSWPDIDKISKKEKPSVKEQKEIEAFISSLEASLNQFVQKASKEHRGRFVSSSPDTKIAELADEINALQNKMRGELVASTRTAIEQLENFASTRPPATFIDIKQTITGDDTGAEIRKPFVKEAGDKNASENVTQSAEDATNLFPDDPNYTPLQKREINRLKQGIDLAAKDREKNIQENLHQVIDPEKIDSFKKEITTKKDNALTARKTVFKQIIDTATKYSDALGLETIYGRKGLATKGDLISALLVDYENGHIPKKLKDAGVPNSEKEAENLESDITAFLTLSTKMHLLEKAISDPIGSIKQLEELPEAHKKSNDFEWQAACHELNKKMDRGCDVNFFFENGVLTEQSLTRPALVFGYKNKIGVTKEQMDILRRVVDDPSALEELRMGLGKSFVIAPLVAKILANKGSMPVILFTEELINLSKKDMDPRAYEFQFQRSPSLSADELAEEYKTLLDVKRQGGYIVSTVARFAALENKYHELMGQLIEKNKSVESAKEIFERSNNKEKVEAEANYKRILEEAKELYSQVGWIKKIYQFFDPTVMKTRFIIDEVDAILNISSEINYAEGLSKNVDTVAEELGYAVFEKILGGTSKNLRALANAIKTNKQANLDEKVFTKAIEELSLALCSDEKIQKKLGVQGKSEEEIESLSNYLCGKKDAQGNSFPRPDFLGPWDKSDDKKHITLIKHWLCKTLPTICKKTYGINFGPGRDGVTIVPWEGGRAKNNTMFGEECEVIGYHLLSYIQQGCSDQDFFIRTCKLIEAKANGSKDPICGEWLNKIGYDLSKSVEEQKDTLIFNFKAPDSHLLRIQFANFFLLSTSKVQLFKNQIPLLVQDMIAERDTAGISGSMNSKALPESFSKKADEPRAVAGDLIMRLQGQQGGMEAKVDTFADPMEKIGELCSNTEYKAIINIGAPFVGMTTKQIISNLREKAPERQFIFIDSEAKTPFIWDIGEKEPKAFDKIRDEGSVNQEKALFYFSPADTRGTDFKIPSGTGAVIPGATTTLADLEQAVWRLRKLGAGQKAEFFLENSIAERIKTHIKKDVVTVADLFKEILLQTTEEDKGSNFKRLAVTPASILKKHIKLSMLRSDDLKSLTDETQFLPHLRQVKDVYKEILPLFRKEQKIDLQADYEVEKDTPVIDVLKQLYEKEISEAKQKQESLRKLTPPPTYLIVAIDTAILEMEERKNALDSPKDTLLSTVDKTIKSNVSVDAGAQCQVEVEQQQTLAIQQTLDLTALTESNEDVDLPEGSELDDIPRFYLPCKNFSQRETTLHALISKIDDQFPMLKNPKIYTSKTLDWLLEEEGSSGLIQAYAVVNSQNEYLLIASSDLEEIYKQSLDTEQGLKIYSISLNETPCTPCFDRSAENTKEDKEFTECLCMAKLVLGATGFSEKEKEIIKDIFVSLDMNQRDALITTLRNKRGIYAANLLSEWKKEKVVAKATITPPPSISTINIPSHTPDVNQGTTQSSTGPSARPVASTMNQPNTENVNESTPPPRREPSVSPVSVDVTNSAAPETTTSDKKKAEVVTTQSEIEPVVAEESKPAVETCQQATEFIIDIKNKCNTSAKKFAFKIMLGCELDKFVDALKKAQFNDEKFSDFRSWYEKHQNDLTKYSTYFHTSDKLKQLYQTIILPEKQADEKVAAELKKIEEEQNKPRPITSQADEKLAASLFQTSTTAASSDIPPNFIMDKGRKGNCASLSIVDQLRQRGVTDYVYQNDLRMKTSNHLKDIIEEIANAGSESPDGLLYSLIETSLANARENLSKNTDENKRKIENIEAYAKIIETDGKWLDSGFFATVAKMLNRQVVILRKNKEGSLELQERFPKEEIKEDEALFLFYNGKITGGGDHYQSIDLNQKQYLSSLIEKDKKVKIVDFRNKIKECEGKTEVVKTAIIQEALKDLKNSSQRLFQVIMTQIGKREIKDVDHTSLHTLTSNLSVFDSQGLI